MSAASSQGCLPFRRVIDVCPHRAGTQKSSLPDQREFSEGEGELGQWPKQGKAINH